jgi:hypothetical protein
MTSNFTIWFQILATVIQVLNAVDVAHLPATWQAGFTALLTIAQAVQGVVAHYYTPTGVSITPGSTVTTPQQVGPQAASTKG